MMFEYFEAKNVIYVNECRNGAIWYIDNLKLIKQGKEMISSQYIVQNMPLIKQKQKKLNPFATAFQTHEKYQPEGFKWPLRFQNVCDW